MNNQSPIGFQVKLFSTRIKKLQTGFIAENQMRHADPSILRYLCQLMSVLMYLCVFELYVY